MRCRPLYTSAGVHSVLLDHGCGSWRREELDQFFRCFRLLRSAMNARRIHRDHLDIRWERAEIIDARSVNQLTDLLKPNLGFTARDDGADSRTGGDLLQLRLDLIGNAHVLEQTYHVVPARPGRIAD